MKKLPFHIAIFLDEPSSAKVDQNMVQGYFLLIPLKDFIANQILLDIRLDVRGRTGRDSYPIRMYTLLKEPTAFKIAEEQKYPFQFKRGDFLHSYKGKNVSFTPYFKTSVDFPDITYWVKEKERHNFEIQPTIEPYEVLNETVQLWASHSWIVFLLGYPFGLLLGILLGEYVSALGLFGGLFIGISIGTAVIPVLKTLMFPSFSAIISEKDEQGFTVQLTKERMSTGGKKAIWFYQVIEKVVDDRGTTTITHEASIFDSIEVEKNEYQLHFPTYLPYPEQPSLGPKGFDEIMIRWKICLVLKSFLRFPVEYEGILNLKNYPVQAPVSNDRPSWLTRERW